MLFDLEGKGGLLCILRTLPWDHSWEKRRIHSAGCGFVVHKRTRLSDKTIAMRSAHATVDSTECLDL